jgi:hypothetical protein
MCQLKLFQQMYIVRSADLTSYNDQILRSPLYIHYCITSAVPVQALLREKQGVYDVCVCVLRYDTTDMSFTLKVEGMAMNMIIRTYTKPME